MIGTANNALIGYVCACVGVSIARLVDPSMEGQGIQARLYTASSPLPLLLLLLWLLVLRLLLVVLLLLHVLYPPPPPPPTAATPASVTATYELTAMLCHRTE